MMLYSSSGFREVSLTSETITSALMPQCTQSGNGGGTPAARLPMYCCVDPGMGLLPTAPVSLVVVERTLAPTKQCSFV